VFLTRGEVVEGLRKENEAALGMPPIGFRLRGNVAMGGVETGAEMPGPPFSRRFHLIVRFLLGAAERGVFLSLRLWGERTTRSPPERVLSIIQRPQLQIDPSSTSALALLMPSATTHRCLPPPQREKNGQPKL
jgi:hypothetical protein